MGYAISNWHAVLMESFPAIFTSLACLGEIKEPNFTTAVTVYGTVGKF